MEQAVVGLQREVRPPKTPKTPKVQRRVRSRQDKENVHENLMFVDATAVAGDLEQLYTPRMQSSGATKPAMLSPAERLLAVPNQQQPPPVKDPKHTMTARTRAILDALPTKQSLSSRKQSSGQLYSSPGDHYAPKTFASNQQNTAQAPPVSVHQSSPIFGASRFTQETATARSFPSAKSSSMEPIAVPRPTILEQSITDLPLRRLKPTLSSERLIRSGDSGPSLKRPPTPSSPYLTCSSERSSQYSSSAEELCGYIEPDELIESREDIDPLVQHFRERYAYSPPLHFVASVPSPMPEQPHLRLIPSRPALAGFDIDKSCECNYLF